MDEPKRQDNPSLELPSVRNLLTEAWSILRTHATILLGYSGWLLAANFPLFLFQTGSETSGWVRAAIFFFSLVQTAVAFWLGILLPLLVRHFLETPSLPFAPLSKKTWLLFPSVLTVELLLAAVLLGGFLLFIFPALLCIVWFGFAPLSAILEEKRGLNAFLRARALVKGRFWKAAWRLLAGPAFLFLLFLLAESALLGILGGLEGWNPEVLLHESISPWVRVVSAVGDLFFLPLLAAYQVLVYRAFVHVTERQTL
ncbi:MAG TPA: hypothetical protein VJB99_00290 [Patescibacteria group bacterium]|nr:hypothetical protein [Patescibacteria group bacterium]